MSQEFRDKTCQCAGAREKNAETSARFFGQKVKGDGTDRLRLFGGVETDQKLRFFSAVRIDFGIRRLIEMDERSVPFRPVRDRRRRIEVFFPRADPGFVGCASLLAWIFENHGCAPCERNRRLEQRPEWPVLRCKSDEEKVAEPRWRAPCLCQGVAISLVNELELALTNQALKFLYDLAHGGRADVLKIPARGTDLIEYSQQIVRRTRDRFRNRGKSLLCRIGYGDRVDSGRVASCDRSSGSGQTLTNMLAQW